MDTSSRALTALDTWYQTPLGIALSTTLTEYLQTQLPPIFGYHAVQLGLPSQREWLRTVNIPHQLVVDSCLSTNTVGACVDFTALPFMNGSLDLVILPHTLSYVDSPEAVLAEVDRVLAVDGHVVIISVNPFSLWGARHLFYRASEKIPWSGACPTIYKLRRALTSFGYDIKQINTLFYRAPIENADKLKQLQFMETMSRLSRMIPGGIFVMVAQKCTLTMTKVQPIWRFKNIVIGKRFIQPATKTFKMK